MSEKHYGYWVHDDGSEVDIIYDTGSNFDDAYSLGYDHGARDMEHELTKERT